VARTADVGLLFDPRRPLEARLCGAWREALQALEPGLRVRRNYPYRGSADGLTTWLRGRFPARQYLGIEVEVNQRFPRGSARRWQALRASLTVSLRQALQTLQRTATSAPARTS
jgi:hypothetical protein